MKCPYCGYQESKVVDSRHSDDGLSIRRRRECLQCQKRFTTYETVESLPIVVIKTRRQPPVSLTATRSSTVCSAPVKSAQSRLAELETRRRLEIEQVHPELARPRDLLPEKIGELVMERLKPLDEVAYVRFASVYRQFKDIDSFMRELNKILEER